MAYQLTSLTQNPGVTLALKGSDQSFWSVANNFLFWYDGCAWQLFTTTLGATTQGVASLAVDALNNIWSIGASDANIYNFNGIGWALQTLQHGGARWLSVGFDGQAWCLDDAANPQVWRFDAPSGNWTQFGHLSGSDPTFVQISSGGTGNGDIFLAAIDSLGVEWRCTNTAGTWEKIPAVPPVAGKSIAAGPDRAVFIADAVTGLLWKWNEGDPGWTQLSDQPGFTSVSVQGDGRLLAVNGNGSIYGGANDSPSLKGFRGSDWNNAGTKIFAVKYDPGANCDKIYRSSDGITFEATPCGQLPTIPPGADYYRYSLPLMIPTASGNGSPEKMLISPLASQTLYLCDDIGQDSLTFEAVLNDPNPRPTVSGIFNGFAEDSDRNVYAGWYSIFSGKNQAILYKSTLASGYRTWTEIKSWDARHIHTVRVNPFNGYLYVVLGEPIQEADPISMSADVARIMRSKDGGAHWTCLTDTWSNTPVVPWTPPPATPLPVPPPVSEYLGLYFAGLGFINGRVVIGEDTDYKPGRIFYFDDDGREAGDPANPLPFVPQATYQTCNDGEFFADAVSLGKRLYFASLFLSKTPGVTSTRCVSTIDGVSWRLEQLCSYFPLPPGDNSTLGILTQHPERGGRLIYSLSTQDSFGIGRPETMAQPETTTCPGCLSLKQFWPRFRT